uniref:BEACH domain-containing protein n=1 Tax=Mesocestoides corti TaxID=53468 RepID=A0A5K3FJE9_MESCO
MFFSRKEFSCLSTVCRQIIDRIRSLQCFILIRAGRLDDRCLYASGCQSDKHFMRQNHSRLLTSVSSLSRSPSNAPLLLLAAVCGSAFATTPADLATASNYAAVAIQELDVFGYLCDLLCEPKPLTMAARTTSFASSPFELFVIPESLSVVSLCSHLAVFDLLTLMASQIALDSLGSHRNTFIRLLAKTLSVVVQCRGGGDAGGGKDGGKTLQPAGIGERVLAIVEDLAQRFPVDLDFLHLCIALLNTSGSCAAANENDQDMAQLVTQLISSVPYFAQPSDPTTLEDLAHVHDSDVNGSGTVSLIRQHWVLPPDWLDVGTCAKYKKGSQNPLAICLPAGTVGFLRQEGKVVVWQHEYSVWPVLNAIVASAEHVLSRENAEQAASSPELTSSECSASISAFPDLPTAVSRLVTCLDFVNACLLTKIEPVRCLVLTDVVWGLVTRVFTEYLSAERETPVGQLLAMLAADHLLPCLIRLTASSAAYALTPSTDGDQVAELFNKLSNSVFRRLLVDRILLPAAVPANAASSQLAQQVGTYTLSDSCFLRFVALSSSSTTPSWMTAEASASTAYRLVSSYLDLALSLLSAEKTAFFSDSDSFSSDVLEEDLVGDETRSPLLACLVFCFEFLIEAGGSNGASGFAIIPKLLQGSPDRGIGILCLVNKALLFLVELLTSYSPPDHDDGDGDDVEKKGKSDSSTSPSCLAPLRFRDLQAYAHRVLSSSRPLMDCLVSLTSVPASSLPISPQSAEFDFLRFSTRPEDEQIGGASALGQHRVQSTWLAFTLLHSVFPSDRNNSSPLLKALNTVGDLRACNDDVAMPYLLKVLTFLDVSCGVGLTRAAVNLLKKMIQFPGKLVTPYLHDIQPELQQLILVRLSSPTEDQITRTGLYDWLSVAVLYDVINGLAIAPFSGPGFTLVRMLSSYASSGDDDAGAHVGSLRDGVIATLDLIAKESGVQCVNLYWSVLKLISAIWTQPMNPFRVQFCEIPNFWQSLSKPFFKHMASYESSKR